MFLTPINFDTENGIDKFKMSLKKIIYSGNWKTFLNKTDIPDHLT